MEFSCVRLKELKSFAGSFINLGGDITAITPWRAESQANNPFADPDDIALIYARDDKGQICGYIGAIPAVISKHGKEKFAWNSGWWVGKNAGAYVSMGLFRAFLNSYNSRIMFSDMTDRTAAIIRSMKLAKVKERPGFHIWLRSHFAKKIVTKKGNLSGIIKFIRYSGLWHVISLTDWFINLFLYPCQLLRAYRLRDKSLHASLLKFPSVEDFKFINLCAGRDVYVPGQGDLEWIYNNPWLIKKDKENAVVAAKYYFSSFAGNNEIFWLRIRNNHQTIGMVMFSLRDHTARTQFVYCLPGNEIPVSRAILAYVLKRKDIKDIISYNEKIVKVLSKIWFPCLRKKRITRYYGICKDLIPFTGDDFTMQDGSGDYVFT